MTFGDDDGSGAFRDSFRFAVVSICDSNDSGTLRAPGITDVPRGIKM